MAETEVGLELKMFDSRVNLDLAAYRKITSDQIVLVQISDASGYLNTPINSGKSRNKGFEAMLNLVLVRNRDFRWEFTANTSYNITKAMSIITDKPGERITTGTHVFNGETRQVVGVRRSGRLPVTDMRAMTRGSGYFNQMVCPSVHPTSCCLAVHCPNR